MGGSDQIMFRPIPDNGPFHSSSEREALSDVESDLSLTSECPTCEECPTSVGCIKTDQATNVACNPEHGLRYCLPAGKT